ncbi:MAG TPA: DNA polymerase III subunit delta [Quisquiliibacterium sp.]|nr:DNA polymerase III subunit delta [Quisquiliibacterium sp.]
MQVRPDALDAALAKRLPALVWVHGDEPLLVLEATDAARRVFRAAGHDERLVLAVERGFKTEALLAETRALSLFASNRLIELRMTGKPTAELGQALAESAAGIDASTRLLVSSARLDRKTTESAWFRAVDAHALVVAVYPVERAQLPQWIGQRLGRQRQRADADTLRFLAERVEGNLLAAHQEIRKLGLLFPEGLLGDDQVRSAVSNVARYDAFGLSDAMLAGDVARVLRSIDGLQAEGEAPPLVLWALTDAVRNLVRLSVARDGGRAPATLMRELRIFGPREALYGQALRRLDTRRLQAALQETARIDRMAKGLIREDPWAAMAALATTLAGAAPPVMPAAQADANW